MAELSAQDFKEVLHVAQKASEPDTVDEFRREVLRLLQKALNAEKANFFLVHDTEAFLDLDRVVTGGIEEKDLRLYRRYYNHLDPFAIVLHPDSPSVIAIQDIVSFKNFVRTEYYNDFLKPQSIHHHMVVNLRSGDRSLGAVSLYRSRREVRFSARDKAKAGLLVGPLAGTLKKTLALEKLQQRQWVLDTLVPDLPYKGILILDRFLYPVYHNENALTILGSLEPSEKDTRGLLPKSIFQPCRALVAQSRSKKGQQNAGRFLAVKSPHTGQEVTVMIRPVFSGGEAFVLLGLEPAEQMLCLKQRLSRHGLSSRELDVVFLVAEGLKNTEIGERLFISPHTVDNHLKSIYRKMKVHNRTSLINRIMRPDFH